VAGDFEVCVRRRSNEHSARQFGKDADFQGSAAGRLGFCDAAGHNDFYLNVRRRAIPSLYQ